MSSNQSYSSPSPSSRLVFKNVPRTYTEQDIRDHLILKTNLTTNKVQSGSPSVDITEVKMLQRHGRFCGVCFVGLKSTQQAVSVQKYWNNAFFDKSRVTVEFASTEQQTWSKHNPKSLTHESQLNQLQQYSNERQERIADIIANAHTRPQKPTNPAQMDQRRLLNHPALFGLSEEEKLKVIATPKFLEFFSLTQTGQKKGKSWENSAIDESFAAAGVALPSGTRAAGTVGASGDNAAMGDGVENAAADDDDDEFFQGPGMTLNDDDDGNQGPQGLIKTVSLKQQMNENDIKKSEKAQRRAEKDAARDEKVRLKLEKIKAKEDRAKEKEQKKLERAHQKAKKVAEQKAQNEKNAAAKKPTSDSDFLRMAMGGFSSDDDDDGDDDDAAGTKPEGIGAGRNEPDSDSESESSSSESESSSDSDDSSDSGSDSDSDSDSDSESDSSEDENDGGATKKKQKTNQADAGSNTGADLVQLAPPNPREAILNSSSLFIRNLPFQAKEEELKTFFSEHGEVAEIAFPIDRAGNSIGYATVIFRLPEDAWVAYRAANGTLFQGRFIHILPGNVPQSQLKNQFSDDQLDAMTHKRKKLMQLKNTAQSNYNWNSLFISQDTIANAVSAKLNISKGSLLGADSHEDNQSAAVRMAVAETHIISETRAFLEEHGVRLDKFTSTPAGGNKVERANTVILVKNIPFSIEENDLRKFFSKFGVIDRLILPPYKTIAIVEMLNPVQAKAAFLNLSYKKVKDTPIYLEWGPKDCLRSSEATANKGGVVRIADNDVSDSGVKVDGLMDEETGPESATLFVKNIHFNTTDEELAAHFTKLLPQAYKHYVNHTHSKQQEIAVQQWRVRICRIKRRTVTKATGVDKNKTVGEMLSLGYGFIEFSHAQAAKSLLSVIHESGGTSLQGHLLALRLSKPSDLEDSSLTNTGSAADLLKKKTILLQKGILSETKLQQQQAWSQQNQKVIVRNIPFEASPKEIRETFQAFGQIKRCTLPLKPGTNQHRGYGFIEFVSPAEAKSAFEALTSTHIFGRHLVIEWAKPDDDVEDLRAQAQEAQRAMQRK